MAIESAISWTDATFNPWIGCTKVSPGCDHCYAERDNSRRKWTPGWGPGVPRKRTSVTNWRQPLIWQRRHEEFYATHGRHCRVFCASLADVFDNEVPDDWRWDLYGLWGATPNLRWLILTKRVGNAMKMLPPDFGPETYPNVGIMATMVNQAEYDRDIGKLMDIPAAWHGISAEPLLQAMQLDYDRHPDWIITGGESGPKRRPLDMRAVQVMRDQCAELGIAFHHKQNGGLNGKDGGCLVDGVEHKAFPEALAA